MPLYTYECPKCGTIFDQIGSFEERETTCQKLTDEGKCGGIARRIPAVPAPAKFNCSMPTAPTRHHKHGRS